MRVPGVAGDDPREALAAPLAEVEPEVVAHRSCAVGTPRIVQQAVNVVAFGAIQMAPDIERSHAQRVPSCRGKAENAGGQGA
jgi:hypothetical protein